jgi:hypothetical protein
MAAGTPAENSRNRLTHFRFGRVGIHVQQALGCQDLRRRAVAALDGPILSKGLLKWVQAFARSPALLRMLAETFDRPYCVPQGLCRQQRSRVDGSVIQQDGVRTRKSMFVAELDAEVAAAAQDRQQSL